MLQPVGQVPKVTVLDRFHCTSIWSKSKSQLFLFFGGDGVSEGNDLTGVELLEEMRKSAFEEGDDSRMIWVEGGSTGVEGGSTGVEGGSTGVDTAALIPGSHPFNGFNLSNFKLSQKSFLNTSVLKAIWLG